MLYNARFASGGNPIFIPTFLNVNWLSTCPHTQTQLSVICVQQYNQIRSNYSGSPIRLKCIRHPLPFWLPEPMAPAHSRGQAPQRQLHHPHPIFSTMRRPEGELIKISPSRHRWDLRDCTEILTDRAGPSVRPSWRNTAETTRAGMRTRRWRGSSFPALEKK